tara:strand:+ start:38 stop:619 length:582 start_codon:yes stop_codon:yes gene_type:complete
MTFYNQIIRRILIIIILGAFVTFLSSCNPGKIWNPPDARKVSPNVNERVKKNLEEGKGWSFKKAMSEKSSGTSYQFASSNPLWRATLDILDFLPLANVDYSGGIITTDWYNEGTASDESIKITVRFLTNEIRSDGLKIVVHKKRCNIQQKCTVKKITSKLEHELQIAILKRAVLFEEQFTKNKKKYKREDLKD